MNDQEKDEFRESIQTRISELEKTIAGLEESSKPVAPDVSLGRLTRMDAIGQKHMSDANLNAARLEREQLLATARKLEENDPNFGKCAKCGGPIPTARLLAVPESDRCVNCA